MSYSAKRYISWLFSLAAAVSLASCDDDAGGKSKTPDGSGDDVECVDSDGCGDGLVCNEDGHCVEADSQPKGPCDVKICEVGATCVVVGDEGECAWPKCLENGRITCGSDTVCTADGCVPEACAGKPPCGEGRTCGADGECAFDVPVELIVGTPSAEATSEDGSSIDIPVKLNNKPTDDVKLKCVITTSSPNTEASVDAECGSFNSENYATEQHVRVNGEPDGVIDGDQKYTLKITTESSDVDFGGKEWSHEFTNKDIDKAEIKLSRTELQTTEDEGEDSFTVVLTSRPTDDVVIKVSSSNTDFGVIRDADADGTKTLTFSAANYNVEQTVTVKGVDDGDIPDASPNAYQIEFAKTTADTNYASFELKPIPVKNLDNDKAEAFIYIVRSEACGANLDDVTEGAAGGADDGTDGTDGVEPASDASDTPAGQPEEEDPDCINGYKEVTVEAEYETEAGSDGSKLQILRTSEGGQSVTMRVKLGLKPLRPVDISITGWDERKRAVKDDEAKTEYIITPSAQKITLDETNYKTGELITIAGAVDNIIDGDITYYIRLKFNSEDDGYDSLDPVWLKVINQDMDVAGYDVTFDTADVIEDEFGAGIGFRIKLKSIPTSNVKLTFIPERPEGRPDYMPDDISISPKTMEFTATQNNDACKSGITVECLEAITEQWNNETHILTVKGMEDKYVDGDVRSIIRITTETDDGDYGRVEQAISVTTMDIDEPKISIQAAIGGTALGGNYMEGTSPGPSFAVKLMAKPEANVTFRLESTNWQALDVADSREATIDGVVTRISTYSITPEQWDTPKNVMLNVASDTAANEVVKINILTVSDDPNFNGLTASTPNYVIMDRNSTNVLIELNDQLFSVGNGETHKTVTTKTTKAKISLPGNPNQTVNVTLHASDEDVITFGDDDVVTLDASTWEGKEVTVTIHLDKVTKSAKSEEQIWGTPDVTAFKESAKSGVTIRTFEKKDFAYTGAVQSVPLLKGNYKLEVWGAQGTGWNSGEVSPGGGRGGYSYGNYNMTSNGTLYVAVGGSRGASCTGGWNGGGDGACSQDGGGATHIATYNRGILSAYNAYRAEVLIVAGGGGGAERFRGGCGGGVNGGDGGTTSQDGTPEYNSFGRPFPGGGTQTAGGRAGYNAKWNGGVYGGAGSFGQGGSGRAADSGPAGGGGWFGGGGMPHVGSAGGGSGHVADSLTASGMVNCSRVGNGMARITLLD